MKHFPVLAVVLLAGGVTMCSAADQCVDASSTIHLSATMLSPVDIRLDWKDLQPAAGHIVEWATETNGNYTILPFAQPGTTSFVHPDLAPQTKCCYRVRPYFGVASEPVEIKTKKLIPDEKVADLTWADPKITSEGSRKKFS